MDTISQSNPDSDLKYQALASEYDERYKGPFWDLYDHVTLELADEILPTPGHVLDAGAGTGKFALRLLERGHQVTLLDPSAEMLKVARHRIQATLEDAPAQYVVGTIESMDFPDGHFDGVFCEGDPLSYCITTHAKAARELIRILRPGGGFYVSCDNRWMATLSMASSGQTEKAIDAADDGVSTDPYGVAVHAFDPDELHQLFVEAGASDVRVTGKVHLTHFLTPDMLERIVKDEDTRQRWHAIEARLARKPSMTGIATHLTVTGRRP